MNQLRGRRGFILLSVFLYLLSTGCYFSGISIRYRTPPRFDPPPFSLQLSTETDPASPTVRIFSPSPSITRTETLTPSFTLTVSYTASSTITWTPWPTWTSFPAATKTNTRIIYPTFTKSRTIGYTPLPSATWQPSWTSPPPALPTSTSEIIFVLSPTDTATASATVLAGTGQPDSTQSPGPSGTPTLTLSPGPTLTGTLMFTPSFTPTITATTRPSPTSSGCNIVYNSGYESQVITLVNNERANAGLPALSMNNSLMSSARGHSVDMALNNYMSHTGSDGSTAWQRMQAAGYVGRWGGENIWVGYSNGTPEAAMSWWMNSTAHRENILGQYYRDIGVGYAYCSTGTYRNYYSINFGAP